MSTFAQTDAAIAVCSEAIAYVDMFRGENERLIGENKSLCARVNDSGFTILSMKTSLRRASQRISKLLRSQSGESSLHTAMHNVNINAKFPIQDTGATDTFYRKSDSKFLSDVKPCGGLVVGLPNGTAIRSIATGKLNTPPITTLVHIFSDDQLERSLANVSVAKTCEFLSY